MNLNDQSGEDPVTMSTGTMSLLEELGESAFRYFMARDSDKDGFLNPVEFLGFYKLLSPIEVSILFVFQWYWFVRNVLDLYRTFENVSGS